MAKYRNESDKQENRGEREQRAKTFKALGNENRLKILDAIRSYQAKYSCCPKDFEALEMRPGSICCVEEITQKFDMAQSTISQHLKEMHNAGLLERHKRAQWVYYTINRRRVEEIAAYLKGLLAGATGE